LTERNLDDKVQSFNAGLMNHAD